MTKLLMKYLVFFILYLVNAYPQGLGNVTKVSILNNVLYLSVGTDVVVFKPCSENILMVNYRPNGIEDPDTLVVSRTIWPLCSAIIDSSTDPISIKSSGFSILINKSPLRFHIYSDKNKLLVEEKATGGIFQNSFELTTTGGTFYGIHNNSTGTLYKTNGGSVFAGKQGQAGGPFTWTNQGWGFLADADGGSFNIGTNSFSFSRIGSEVKQDLECYFIIGSPKKIIQGMDEITGMPPLFPKYSLGFLNTEWGIDQSELYSDIRTYRKKLIPIDAYILDFDWMDWGGDNYGEFRWGSKFPDGISGLIVDTLKQYNMHLMGIRKPRVHLNTIQGQYAQSKGFFTDYVTDYFSGKQVGRINFFNPDARSWYWESFAILNKSYEKGITGFWNDEADEYGGNLMFMQMQRAQYEGQRAYNNNRVFSINRNFYTGAQRYGYGLWSGDIQTGFSSMASQRLFMISSMTVGASWWSMDIGGFNGTPSSENYFRWIQFGAFVPIFRVHGSNNLEREPWQYGSLAESIATNYINLRYSLMPYIYSAAWENHCTGVPLTRPLVMEFPDDPATENISSEWMFGNDILVSPVVIQGATSQSVYFPEGNWYDFHTGKLITGAATIDVPITNENIPIFIKGGAIIPMSNHSTYTDANEMKNTMILSSYPNGIGSCILYEDDGLTYNYEKGMYHTTSINHKRNENIATIDIENGTGPFVIPDRDWLAEFNWISISPDSVLLDGTSLKKCSTNADLKLSVKGWYFDSASQKCYGKFPDDKTSHNLKVYFSNSMTMKVEEETTNPHFYLDQNYPNPFNPSTVISYQIPVNSFVTLKIFDTYGREIETLVNKNQTTGIYQVTWLPKSAKSGLPSGIYYFKLQTEKFSEMKKMIYIR